jgi:hypothetical protein
MEILVTYLVHPKDGYAITQDSHPKWVQVGYDFCGSPQGYRRKSVQIAEIIGWRSCLKVRGLLLTA